MGEEGIVTDTPYTRSAFEYACIKHALSERASAILRDFVAETLACPLTLLCSPGPWPSCYLPLPLYALYLAPICDNAKYRRDRTILILYVECWIRLCLI